VTDWLRRGGCGRDPDGWWVIWSVAEGSRGRRWREVRNRDVHVATSLLLETGRDGRFSHLELSTSTGLLSLHPEADGTLHGNAVTSEGVEHVRGKAWDRDALVLLEGSTICKVAAAHLLRETMPAFSSIGRMAVRIPTTLWLEIAPVRVERVAPDVWRINGGEPLHLTDDGLPVLAEGEIWQLEE
jgi:hypothetical protein